MEKRNEKITAKMITEAEAMNVAFNEALALSKRISVSGKFDIIQRGNQIISRSDLRTICKDSKSGITYVGRNSAKEKCISCSPLTANVNWERFSFAQDAITHELWICECGRCYPSGKGKKNFPSLKSAE